MTGGLGKGSNSDEHSRSKRSIYADLDPEHASSALFDHLIRGGKQRRRDRQTEPLGGLEVDDELILRRRLYRQIGRFGAAKDAIGVTRRAIARSDRIPAPYGAGMTARIGRAVPCTE
jgi:hypothetical protein